MITINMAFFLLGEKEKKNPIGYNCLVKHRGGVRFHWNYLLDKVKQYYFVWNNIMYSKTNKKRNLVYTLSFKYVSIQEAV